MSERNISVRAQAGHCRELALWTSDERTQHILMQMAHELETQEADETAPTGESAPRILPPSLS